MRLTQLRTRLQRRWKFAAGVAASLAMVLGVAVLPAAGAPADQATTASVAPAAECSGDSNPRSVTLYTSDPGDIGGDMGAEIFVTRSSVGYYVCIDASYGFVYDMDGDGWGAVAYAKYDVWNGTSWRHVTAHELAKDCCSANGGEFINFTIDKVKNFYVFVCLYQGSEVRHCSRSG